MFNNLRKSNRSKNQHAIGRMKTKPFATCVLAALGLNILTDHLPAQPVANFEPILLNIQVSNSAPTLIWTNPSFVLQAAPTPGGAYTNIPGAVSPYTNNIVAPVQYFRLKKTVTASSPPKQSPELNSSKYSVSSLAFFGSLLLPMTGTAAESDTVPSDFKLCAEFHPGFSDWKPWKVTVTADGKALKGLPHAWVDNGTPSEKILTLTAKDVRDLLTAVRASRFFTLKGLYAYACTDESRLILQVTLNGDVHEVEVYAPGQLKDNDGVKKFLEVWNEVLRKVPAPNAKQTPQ